MQKTWWRIQTSDLDRSGDGTHIKSIWTLNCARHYENGDKSAISFISAGVGHDYSFFFLFFNNIFLDFLFFSFFSEKTEKMECSDFWGLKNRKNGETLIKTEQLAGMLYRRLRINLPQSVAISLKPRGSG